MCCISFSVLSTQPERILGAQYTIKSDVWSLGISLIELALGRSLFTESHNDDSDLSEFDGTLSPSRMEGSGMPMGILELLQRIVNEPAPRLTPEGRFPADAEAFVDSCLVKDPDVRKTPKELSVSDRGNLHTIDWF